MKTKDMKSGISLIVLIITIIVVIILAAVVILTLSKNNPIESAKEARFKEDVRTFQDELALYISKQYANAGGHWDGSISAKSCDEIVEYIPSFTKKYEGKFIINNNNLEYTNNLDEKEKEYAQSLNVKERLLPIEYQQVEYIESTGTQYIDTGYCNSNANSNKQVISYQITAFPSSSFYSLIGTNFQEKRSGIICCRTDGKTTVAFGNVRAANSPYFFDTTLNKESVEIYSNSISNKYMITHNGERSIEYNISNTNNNNKTWGVFCVRNTSGEFKAEFSKIKLFNYSIWENDILIREFIPCYVKTTVTNVDGLEIPENTRGLYDLVEGKFYTNQGTGEFISGPEVNE